LLYTCHVNIDYDGASTAYGPPEKETLDSLRDAGYPLWWYGLLSLHPAARIGDMNDKSYAQFKIGTTGELATKYFGVDLDKRYPDTKGRCPVKGDDGYFVSATPHYHGAFRDMYKQSSYTNAAKVAFGALSGNLETKGGVAVGDCGLALSPSTAQSSTFYFADRGATSGEKAEAVGECSYALFLNLGGEKKVPGKTPDNNFPVSFLVFPGSKTGDDSGAMENLARAQFNLMNAAGNRRELALLMAFAASVNNGTSGLNALLRYRTNPASAPPGPWYHNVLRQLRTLGLDVPAPPGPGPLPLDTE
jgi:hypothetical protein